MISDLLDMARLEAGMVELAPEALDIVSIIEEGAARLREAAEARNISIVLDVPATVSLVADARAVKQILAHLVTNAVKFAVPGGRVVVELRQTRDGTAITVRDDGVGIPASELPRLGRAFEQVSKHPHLAKGGAGLGLALARALAERHNGTMRIASEEGVGTAVTVEFPQERSWRDGLAPSLPDHEHAACFRAIRA